MNKTRSNQASLKQLQMNKTVLFITDFCRFSRTCEQNSKPLPHRVFSQIWRGWVLFTKRKFMYSRHAWISPPRAESTQKIAHAPPAVRNRSFSQKLFSQRLASLYIPSVKLLSPADESLRHLPGGHHFRHALIPLNVLAQSAVSDG